ncbi:hypothetical protein ILUMI_11342, partial [Ignelater luminosus]
MLSKINSVVLEDNSTTQTIRELGSICERASSYLSVEYDPACCLCDYCRLQSLLIRKKTRGEETDSENIELQLDENESNDHEIAVSSYYIFKILSQKLRSLKINWGIPIPEDVCNEWSEFRCRNTKGADQAGSQNPADAATLYNIITDWSQVFLVPTPLLEQTFPELKPAKQQVMHVQVDMPFDIFTKYSHLH